VLGLLNAAALIAFGRSVQRAFGTSAGIWFALFQASQFHVMYYASRTLPNMFALIFSMYIVLACYKQMLISSKATLRWGACSMHPLCHGMEQKVIA
tara:strand:+ start:17859 stop:18146 length:288 start_codon:yes stop_codon:yes gene_type:complete